MSQPQPDNEMASLYERFVKDLAEGSDLSAYSEDDLLDIYDYTRSIPDDYTALEVLIAGMRMYPSSTDMAKRKVLYFHDFEQDAAVMASAEALPADSLVRNIAHFKVKLPADAAEAKARLLRMTARVPDRSIEDGDLYFLIETFNDLEYIDCLSDESEMLGRKCAYPITLEQELYKIYTEKGDVERALRHCHALTTLQPFEYQWWEELANAYINLTDDRAAALEAVEYALALAPDNLDILTLKATVLAPAAQQEAAEICKEVLRRDPDFKAALFINAYLQYQMGDHTGANSSLEGYARLCEEPLDRGFFDLIFESTKEELSDEFYAMLNRRVTLTDASELYLWAISLSDNGLLAGAHAVLESALKLHKFDNHTLGVRLLAEVYYRREKYVHVIELLDSIDDANIQADLLTTLIYGLARKHAGRTEGLKALLEQRLKSSSLVVIDGLSTSERNMMLRGVRHHLVYLMRALDGEEFPPNAYDPFL